MCNERNCVAIFAIVSFFFSNWRLMFKERSLLFQVCNERKLHDYMTKTNNNIDWLKITAFSPSFFHIFTKTKWSVFSTNASLWTMLTTVIAKSNINPVSFWKTCIIMVKKNHISIVLKYSVKHIKCVKWSSSFIRWIKTS